MEESVVAHPRNLQPHNHSQMLFPPKRAAPVVGILTHLGEEEKDCGSGFVIESNAHNGIFVSSILTSASLLRPQPYINEVMNDIEVFVVLDNGLKFNGTISTCNFHYNVGIIEIGTEFPLEIAKLRLIDDSFSIYPDGNLLSYRESGKYRLCPGEIVAALGRSSYGTNSLMAISGEYGLNHTGLECKELLWANFEISSYGIGGPMINSYGEVIGITFYGISFTPFLPINIALMWWEQSKRQRSSPCLVPQLGMNLKNLYQCGLSYLEHLVLKFPNIFKGVVIQKITSESMTLCGLLATDIIIKCDGNNVESTLQFLELVWDKIGEPMELTVIRPDVGSQLRVNVVLDHVKPNQTYKWPRMRKRMRERKPFGACFF